MYKALITTLQIKPHPKADRLELAIIDSGEQVVIGKGTHQNGDKVLYCAEGGQLSEEYCHNNNEYRENHGINKDPGKYGFFDEKRRIKIIQLRGEVSNGYIIPFNAFDWLGPNDLNSLSVGTEIDTVNDHVFCEKYFTRATRERMKGIKNSPKSRIKIKGFEKHFDTSQLARHYKSIPENAVFYITEKIHATSGRTGYLTCQYTKPPVTWWEKLHFKFMDLIGKRQTTDIEGDFLVSGSRNVDYNPLQPVEYTNYRNTAQELFRGKLHLGETVFYELCYTGQNNTAIQNSSINKSEEFGKQITKQYGEHIQYTYGVKPNEVTVFVYRITQQTGSTCLELSTAQIQKRIREMYEPRIVFVPCGAPFTDKTLIHQKIKTFIGGGQSLLARHPMEGICLRIEHPNVPANMSILKFKTDVFCYLEGIQKNDNNYVDPEEIS